MTDRPDRDPMFDYSAPSADAVDAAMRQAHAFLGRWRYVAGDREIAPGLTFADLRAIVAAAEEKAPPMTDRPILPEGVAGGSCRFCGCWTHQACDLGGGATCGWVRDSNRTLCTAPACLAKAGIAAVDRFGNPAKAPQ